MSQNRLSHRAEKSSDSAISLSISPFTPLEPANSSCFIVLIIVKFLTSLQPKSFGQDFSQETQKTVNMRPTLRCVHNFQLSRRCLSTTLRPLATSPFYGPAPPRLPKEEQELYERLQRSSTGAFSTPKPSVVVNQSPAPSPQTQRPRINQSPHSTPDPALAQDGVEEVEQNRNGGERLLEEVDARVQATGRGEELHPDVRRGSKPEFDGDRNPKTGETGGPKNEPLRWGGDVDWSYNGRVTDF